MMTLLVAGFDRLAFGTGGTRELYPKYVRRSRVERRSALFEAVPSPCRCLADASTERGPGTWCSSVPSTSARASSPRCGRGTRSGPTVPTCASTSSARANCSRTVRAWAADRPEVTLEVDPPRARIHAALRGARRADPALAAGRPVARAGGPPDRRGARARLRRGHHRRDRSGRLARPARSCRRRCSAGTGEVADAVARALRLARPESDVLADLPSTDSRIAADEWLLFAGRGRR